MAKIAKCGINFLELGSRLSPLISAAKSGNTQAVQRSGLVVVLDMHGLLVERIPRKEKARLAEARKYRSSWQSQRNHIVWLRPHVRVFLDLAYMRHDIAVWSSAQAETVDRLLEDLSNELKMTPSMRSRMQFIWHRKMCKPDLESGRFATLKYLKDLWDWRGFGNRYSSKNTLLLDDSATKYRHFPNSGIPAPEYKAEIIKERYNNDDTLIWILLYLEYLLEEAKKESTKPDSFDIAGVRAHCLGLEDFIMAGELEARNRTNLKERRKAKSLAYVFLQEKGETAATSQLEQETVEMRLL